MTCQEMIPTSTGFLAVSSLALLRLKLDTALSTAFFSSFSILAMLELSAKTYSKNALELQFRPMVHIV